MEKLMNHTVGILWIIEGAFYLLTPFGVLVIVGLSVFLSYLLLKNSLKNSPDHKKWLYITYMLLCTLFFYFLASLVTVLLYQHLYLHY